MPIPKFLGYGWLGSLKMAFGKMILIWSIKDFEMHVCKALCKVGIIRDLLPFDADEHFPPLHHRKSDSVSV